MFVVMITPTQDDSEDTPVGPFPDAGWANRYVERVKEYYYHVRVEMLDSPILLDPTQDDPVVFDPARGVDRPSREID